MPNQAEHATESARFAAEMKRRFDELVDWAIANSLNRSAPLRKADFELCRKEIEKLADRDFDMGERNAKVPEPSENGPQYVSTNPAPWP
jgi:hypothetical protein